MAGRWQETLKDYVVEPASVVGIGRTGSGDDGLGPEVVRLVRGRTRAALFDCQTVPENFIGPIARSHPACIILVDAAPAGDQPGDVAIFAIECLHHATFHTHASTPALFLDALVERTGAACFMIGVHPKVLGLDRAMSPEVARAALEIADEIARLLPPTPEDRAR